MWPASMRGPGSILNLWRRACSRSRRSAPHPARTAARAAGPNSPRSSSKGCGALSRRAMSSARDVDRRRAVARQPAGEDRRGIHTLAGAVGLPADAPRRLFARRADRAHASRETFARRPVLSHSERPHGRLLLRNVRDAAKRGVRVRLLVDDLYTFGADPMFIGLSAFPNIEVRLFNPFCCGRDSLMSRYMASLMDFRRLNHRMHNKLFIADGAMAVAGGRNIADEYFTRSMSGNFVDMDAFIIGGVVPKLERIFDAYWNSAHAYPIAQVIATDRTREQLQADFNKLVDEGDQMMKVSMPPNDILGYGPITEDLEAGRLGLEWGMATAFADSPDKVSAMTTEEARSMSVTMNVFDLVTVAREEVVFSSPYSFQERLALRRSATCASAA